MKISLAASLPLAILLTAGLAQAQSVPRPSPASQVASPATPSSPARTQPTTTPTTAAPSTSTPSTPATRPAPAVTADYRIVPGDKLSVQVYKDTNLSQQLQVRPDGKITLPLVDDIKVVGLTPDQLRAILTEKLKPFITIPRVTVAVSQINSRKVYLIGEVLKTGTFSINSSTTVLQILAQAGGVKDFAKRKDIYVLRHEQGKQLRYRFNYNEVIRGQGSEQNISLRPGDTRR